MTDEPAAKAAREAVSAAAKQVVGNVLAKPVDLAGTNWLAVSLLLTLGIQLFFYIAALAFQTDKLSDFAGTLNFAFLALLVFVGNFSGHERGLPLLRAGFVTLAVLAWSIRLGVYLAIRVWWRGRDERFDELRASWWKLALFWAGQVAWVWTVSLPVVLLNQSASHDAVITRTDKLGLVLWLAGFAIETLADWQKWHFHWKPKERKDLPFISTGLWRFSRHPNYFGEVLLWTGIWWMSISGTPYGLIGFLGPIFTLVIVVFVSGIPVSERIGERRFRRLVAYNQYKTITSPFVPLPPRFYATLPAWVKHWLFFERHNPIIQRPIKRRRLRVAPAASAVFAAAAASDVDGTTDPSSPLM